MTITLPPPDVNNVNVLLQSLTPSAVITAALAVLYATVRVHVRHPTFYPSTRDWVGTQLTSPKAAATYLAGLATGWTKFVQWVDQAGYGLVPNSVWPVQVGLPVCLGLPATVLLGGWAVRRLVTHWTETFTPPVTAPQPTGREPASVVVAVADASAHDVEPSAPAPAPTPKPTTIDVVGLREKVLTLCEIEPSSLKVTPSTDGRVVIDFAIRTGYGNYRAKRIMDRLRVAHMTTSGSCHLVSTEADPVRMHCVMTPQVATAFLADPDLTDCPPPGSDTRISATSPVSGWWFPFPPQRPVHDDHPSRPDRPRRDSGPLAQSRPAGSPAPMTQGNADYVADYVARRISGVSKVSAAIEADGSWIRLTWNTYRGEGGSALARLCRLAKHLDVPLACVETADGKFVYEVLLDRPSYDKAVAIVNRNTLGQTTHEFVA